jgi:hypothetical protein
MAPSTDRLRPLPKSAVKREFRPDLPRLGETVVSLHFGAGIRGWWSGGFDFFVLGNWELRGSRRVELVGSGCWVLDVFNSEWAGKSEQPEFRAPSGGLSDEAVVGEKNG